MVKKIYIHPGFHKTGTTSLQQIFAQNRIALRENGIIYPYSRGSGHHRAAWALHGRVWGWKTKGGEVPPISEWKKIVSQVKKSRESALISSEFFAELTIEEIKKFREAFPATDFEVIFTWRPMQKLLPSSYQQYLKYGIKATYEEWLHGIFMPDQHKNYSPSFWQRHKHGEVIAKWVEVFGAESVKLIVANESEPDFLYRSFADQIKVDREVIKPLDGETRNRSLTAQETALLLEVNRRFPKERPWSEYEIFIREGAFNHLSNIKSVESNPEKLLTPGWAAEAAKKQNEINIAKIKDLKIEVVGNLDEASEADVLVGQNAEVLMISLAVAAEAILGPEIKIIKRFSAKIILQELTRRIKLKLLIIKRRVI